MRPKPLLIAHYNRPESPKAGRKDQRNSLRTDLRDAVNGGLVTLTGKLSAKMWYAIELYAKRVVFGLGYKLNDDPGWPSDIPFRDLNRIPGGTRVFKRLLALWNSGQLRFVRATDEDKRNAYLNPHLLIPNAAQRAAALAIPRAPSTKLIRLDTDSAELSESPSSRPTGVVLHPATMNPHFTFSLVPGGPPAGAQGAKDASDASKGRPRERAQRSDINKSRKRPVTNPEGRELRHPKRGPLTTKCVVEADGVAAGDVGAAIESGRIVLTDEILAGCTEIRRGG